MSLEHKLIKTNDPNVIVYEDLLMPEDCEQIANYTIEQKVNNPIYEGLPWEKDNNILTSNISNKYKDYIVSYRWMLNTIASMYYNKILYPTHSDIVLWNTGDQMAPHVDNGMDGTKQDIEELGHRHYSAVTYLNDGFTGGETFVDNYVNKPKTGSAIIFPSNYYHGVHEILSGQRVTFAMWFTLDPNKIEKLI
jgi:hypothetical protein